jgi:hypothetical protein
MERALQSYKFVYRDAGEQVIGTLETKCLNDDAAIERGMTAKPRVAASLEIACGERTVLKRKLDLD